MRGKRMQGGSPKQAASLLAPLNLGDQIPWKLDSRGEPQWLTVTDVIDEASYAVRYPDGTVEILTDSE
jgi:hypothetical protein